METTPKKWEKHTHKLLKGKSISRFLTSNNNYSLKIIGNQEQSYLINLIKVEEAVFEGVGWSTRPPDWPIGEFNLKETAPSFFLNKKILDVKIHTNLVRIKVGFYKKKGKKYEEIPTSILIFKEMEKVILLF